MSGARSKPPGAIDIFAGPGEIRALCRARDWSATPLGPVDEWPVSLRAAVQMVLGAGTPMIMFWGPQLAQIFNDRFRPSLGEDVDLARALGAPGAEFWAEIWPHRGPQIERVMAGGAAVQHADVLIPMTRDGRRENVWWSWSDGPLYGDDGEIAGVLVDCQETTPRVRESQRLAYVFQHAPTFLAILRGPDYVFELVNTAYYEHVGRRELLGRPIREALPELQAQGIVWELLDGVRSSKVPYVGRESPVFLSRTPGEPLEQRFVDFVYLPLIEENGECDGVIAHGSDVTEQVLARREIEHLLGESERARRDAERLQALTASLAAARTMDDISAVVLADIMQSLGARTGALSVHSPEGDELVVIRTVGFPESQLERIGRQSVGMQSPAATCYRTGMPLWIESRDGAHGLNARYPVIAPVWDILGVNAAAFVPLIVAGSTVGVLSFGFERERAFDASERAFLASLGQQAALALERARLFDAEHAARAEAERANKAKSEFLAIMSHELRTPLNAIDGYAELMELGVRGPITDDQRHDLARIRKSEKHLLGLINGVLNYAQVEAGAVHYEIEAVPLDETLATCEALVTPQARLKGLTLVRDRCDAALVARADREKLQQILLNLLSNAVKFTPTGGRIELRCVPPTHSGVVQVQVRDSGMGIPPSQIARIFEPFVQIDSELTRTREGSGLGLAISRDLARGMGGELAVESALGEGSTFTVTLRTE